MSGGPAFGSDKGLRVGAESQYSSGHRTLDQSSWVYFAPERREPTLARPKANLFVHFKSGGLQVSLGEGVPERIASGRQLFGSESADLGKATAMECWVIESLRDALNRRADVEWIADEANFPSRLAADYESAKNKKTAFSHERRPNPWGIRRSARGAARFSPSPPRLLRRSVHMRSRVLLSKNLRIATTHVLRLRAPWRLLSRWSNLAFLETGQHESLRLRR